MSELSLDLRLVQQFLAVADLLSFRKAAERMHMAQPPLSQAIMRLEGLIGTQLFDRTPPGVRLTHAGEVFKVEAVRLLNQATSAVDRTQRAGRGESGSLHIGFIGPAMFAFLPKVIREFRKLHPGVALHLHEGSSIEVAALLNADSLDLGFLLPPGPFADDVVVTEIVTDYLIAVLPTGHRLSAQHDVKLEDLAGDDFVLFSAKGVPALRAKIIALCLQAGFEPNIVQEAVQTPTVLGLVAGGLGVSLVPSSVRALASQGVLYKSISGDADALRVSIGVAYREGLLSRAAHAFLTTATQIAHEAAQ
jgi:DNA-binding transcriptional LysR family regulator